MRIKVQSHFIPTIALIAFSKLAHTSSNAILA